MWSLSLHILTASCRPPSRPLIRPVTTLPTCLGHVHGHYPSTAEKPKSSVMQSVAKSQVREEKGLEHHEERTPTETERMQRNAWAFCTSALVFVRSFLPIVRALLQQ